MKENPQTIIYIIVFLKMSRRDKAIFPLLKNLSANFSAFLLERSWSVGAHAALHSCRLPARHTCVMTLCSQREKKSLGQAVQKESEIKRQVGNRFFVSCAVARKQPLLDCRELGVLQALLQHRERKHVQLTFKAHNF